MPTKDPHIAMIDAQEKLHKIRAAIKTTTTRVMTKIQRGEPLTADDKYILAAIRQEAIDATRRVQDEFLEEIESHGKLTES